MASTGPADVLPNQSYGTNATEIGSVCFYFNGVEVEQQGFLLAHWCQGSELPNSSVTRMGAPLACRMHKPVRCFSA